jgi:surfeit locus 1 family protein
MDADAHRPRSNATMALVLGLALLAFSGFVALGLWQVQRLGWKEALIARVDRQLKAAPVPAPTADVTPTREADEYKRVTVQGRYDYGHEATVRASTALGGGYWVLTPLQRADGSWVIINRGFVPQEMRAQIPRGEESAGVVGLLRLSEPGGSLLQSNMPAQGRWYSRDVAAIAKAQGLAGPVAQFFIDAQVTPQTANAWPRPGLTVVQFRNDHLFYALTWFALAAIMAVAMAYLVIDERRARRLSGVR